MIWISSLVHVLHDRKSSRADPKNVILYHKHLVPRLRYVDTQAWRTTINNNYVQEVIALNVLFQINIKMFRIKKSSQELVKHH